MSFNDVVNQFIDTTLELFKGQMTLNEVLNVATLGQLLELRKIRFNRIQREQESRAIYTKPAEPLPQIFDKFAEDFKDVDKSLTLQQILTQMKVNSKSQIVDNLNRMIINLDCYLSSIHDTAITDDIISRFFSHNRTAIRDDHMKIIHGLLEHDSTVSYDTEIRLSPPGGYVHSGGIDRRLPTIPLRLTLEVYRKSPSTIFLSVSREAGTLSGPVIAGDGGVIYLAEFGV